MNRLEEMKQIISTLNVASKAYYQSGNPIMSDLEYDNLYETLKIMEKETGIVYSDSPTQTVGVPVDDINVVKHSHLMLSLDKAHTAEEIISFMNKQETVCMFKLDGLTISAEYDDGILQSLHTRGDGHKGNDILFHAPAFKNLPLTIPYKGKYIVDGEAIISYKDFDIINSKLSGNKKYENPRNLASGTLNNHDPKITKERNIQFIAWDVIDGDDSNYLSERLKNAKEYGFDTVEFKILKYNDIDKESFKIYADDMRELAKTCCHPIDGLVFKFNNIEYGKSLGGTSKFFNNAIAYKFEDNKYSTKLKYIDWTLGKTGAITPTIVFEPVRIDGSTVERASVHNISIFKQLHFTNGCTCYIYKANQIIPQCDSTENDGNGDVEIPDVCPVCGGKAAIISDSETEVLRCINPECKGKLLGKMKCFVSKKGMNIDGLSEATLEKFIELGWIDTFYDLYQIGNHSRELKMMDGFGAKSVENLLNSLEKSKDVELSNFIAAMSILGIGASQSKVIAKEMKTWQKFVESGKGRYDFTNIDGIGDVLNTNIHRWFKEAYDKENIENLAQLMNFKKEEEVFNNKSLDGMTFVITGTVNIFKNRDEIKHKIESLGGKVSGSVSKNTTALINNDTESNSSKNQKAKQLGIKIISEKDLLEIMEGNS